MFHYFRLSVYVVAATIVFTGFVASGVGALHWARGIQRMKFESCQRLLMALQLERPVQFRGLVLKDPDPCRRLDEAADALNLPREFQVGGDRLARTL